MKRIELLNQGSIRSLGEKGNNKHLRILERIPSNKTEMKNVTKEDLTSIKNLYEPKLCLRNLIKGKNT